MFELTFEFSHFGNQFREFGGISLPIPTCRKIRKSTSQLCLHQRCMSSSAPRLNWQRTHQPFGTLRLHRYWQFTGLATVKGPKPIATGLCR